MSERTATDQATAIAIEKLRPEEGEVLVIRGLDPLQTGRVAHCLRIQWANLPYKVPVLVVPDGATVTLETLEQLRSEMEETDGQ
jgi:hypothetical protein